MQRYTERSSSRVRPSTSAAAAVSRPLRTAFMPWTKVSHPLAHWYMLGAHEHTDGAPPSVGRNRTGKSDRDAVAQTRDGGARDDCADLPETRLPRADALA